MNLRASTAKLKSGGEHPYVAVVDGAEIMGMKFKTRAEALLYAEWVISLQDSEPDRARDLRGKK
jgi:hypothetical protein